MARRDEKDSLHRESHHKAGEPASPAKHAIMSPSLVAISCVSA